MGGAVFLMRRGCFGEGFELLGMGDSLDLPWKCK